MHVLLTAHGSARSAIIPVVQAQGPKRSNVKLDISWHGDATMCVRGERLLQPLETVAESLPTHKAKYAIGRRADD